MTLLASGQAFAAIRGVDYDPTDLAALMHLEGASGLVERYCRRSFAAVYDDEVLIDGSGGECILLDSPPVWDVHDIVYRQPAADDVEVEDATWAVDEAKGLLWKADLCGAWWRGIKNYGLTFSHGYKLAGEAGEAPELPPEISLVTMALAQRGLAMSSSFQGSAGAVTSESIGSYSVSYSDGGSSSDSVGFTIIERLALSKHRLPSVGR